MLYERLFLGDLTHTHHKNNNSKNQQHTIKRKIKQIQVCMLIKPKSVSQWVFLGLPTGIWVRHFFQVKKRHKSSFTRESPHVGPLLISGNLEHTENLQAAPEAEECPFPVAQLFWAPSRRCGSSELLQGVSLFADLSIGGPHLRGTISSVFSWYPLPGWRA